MESNMKAISIIHESLQENLRHAEIRKDSQNSLEADELGRDVLYDALDYLQNKLPQSAAGRYTDIVFCRLCRETWHPTIFTYSLDADPNESQWVDGIDVDCQE